MTRSASPDARSPSASLADSSTNATLRRLIEQAPVSIAMFDRAMRYVAVSELWKQKIVRMDHDLIGRSLYEVHPDLPDRWRRIHDRALSGENIRHEADEWTREDGSKQCLRWAIQPWTDANAHIAGLMIFAEDITERKKAEALFRESEARFHQMFDHMQEGCQIIGFDWRFLYLNQSVERHSRERRQVLLGHSMLEAFPGFEGTLLYEHLKGCMRDRIPRRMERRIDYRDGGYAWFDFSIQPCPEGVLMLTIDITERKKAEETLAESEERYRSIVETSHEGIWRVDAANRIVFVNTRMAQILGYTPQEMIGTPAFDYFDESTLDQMRARAEARRQGHAEEYIVRLHRKDGKEVWILINSNPLFDATGRFNGSLAMVTDITERKRTEALLQASEERFRDLAESLPQLIWTCRPDGHGEYLSSQWEEYTGIPAAELTECWLEYIHPDDTERMSADWMAAVSANTTFQTEYRVKRHDGVYRWFSARATPKSDAQGNIERWYGANTDIEDEKRARESLLRSQKMEALGTLAGGIAHDFNNILLAITGNTAFALEDAEHDSSVRQCLIDIDQASRRAADLVRRILSYSRQEEPQRKVVALQPVIEEALQLLRATVPAQIELRVHYEPDTPRTICDATQVHQILINLVTNAAYAIGDRPGHIEIRLELASVDGERVIPELRPGQYARLCVADDGCGMTRETISRIFDPFFTTKPAGHGTGLGLSVVDGIMKTHGGAINVYSEPNQGTVFRLYFPATGEREQPVARPQHSHSSARGQSVLYIDDDELLVSLIKRKLTRLGYAVSGEQDPRAALEKFRKDPMAFDAVVTDLSMPGMRGFELAREMLAIRPELPVIVTSGFVRPEDQDAAREIGVTDLILKPNTSDELGAALDKVFKVKPA